MIHILYNELRFSFLVTMPKDFDKKPLTVILIAVARGEKPFWDISRGYPYSVPEAVEAAVMEKITENILFI